MKVKVGDKIYDSENEPVMVSFSKKEKTQIVDMPHNCLRYCVYPDTERFTKDDCAGIKEWMEAGWTDTEQNEGR